MSFEKFISEVGTALVGGKENAKKLKGVLREWDEEADRRVDKRFREQEKAKRAVFDWVLEKLRPARKKGK